MIVSEYLTDIRHPAMHRACYGKVRYPSRAKARKMNKFYANKFGRDRQDIYPCDICGGYHLATRRRDAKTA